ncbi:MAG: T9SS type A sorting domain-containing protein [Chlorobi bacterium]|nr:T9SS type A sorting domain-containing protein [Chlorobiota bacterium]
MRRILPVLIAFFITSFLFAENYTIKLSENHEFVKISENTYQSLSITINLQEIKSFNVTSEKGLFNEINIPGLTSTGEIGTPKLPALKKLIDIPFGAKVTVEVKNYSVSEYSLKEYGIDNYLMPVQPSVSKDVDIADVPFEFKENFYKNNKFIEYPLANVKVLGVLRGMRLARLEVAPVQYNPVTGIIKVYNNIELNIRFTGSNKNLTEHIKASTYSPYFEPLYKAVLNKNAEKSGVYEDHPDLTKYPVKYLIVANRMFEDTLQEFINWKVKKGFNVIVAYTDEIGETSDEIKTYIHNLYNSATEEDPAPTFVLFVGDVQQVPASATGSSSGKKTDLYYCSVDGDYFPEMYYGRFSATSPAQLQHIIDKTLYYEQYRFEDPSYLDRVTLIAGADGTWNPNVGQPTVKYGTENYFNVEHGYSSVNDYLDSYSGCYETVNEGVGFINYTAHCSETGWADPALGISQVNAFTNENMYPLAVGNCCLAADFGYSECAGETWLRGENKGAVAYIGSSPSSYWFEDFYWAVGAFPISGDNNGYVPTAEETTWGAFDAPFLSDYVSVDAMIFIGNLAVTEVDVQNYPQHSSPLYYWQAYNCLGDPSLIIYHTQGEENNVGYMDILPLGVNQFEVNAEPGSYVAISFNGVLHGTALVDQSGVASVIINPIIEAGTADIVITKPQFKPVINQITVAPLNGPYVLVDSVSFSDPDGNGDNLANNGEVISVNPFLKNVGTVIAGNVNVVLRTDDENVSITDSLENWGNINPDAVSQINNAFSFLVSDRIEDQHNVVFKIFAKDTSVTEPWTSGFNCVVNAPKLMLGSYQIEDSIGGNGNGRLDPGEMIKLYINVKNTGHNTANNSKCILSSRSEFVEIQNSEFNLGLLSSNSDSVAEFNFLLSSEAPIGEVVDFTFTFMAENYVAVKTISKKVGLILDDFETGDLTSYDWEIDSLYPWIIDTTTVYEGLYSVKSSGISDEQTAILQLSLQVDAADSISFYKKVSSEETYDFLRFYIDGNKMDQWSGEDDWSNEAYAVDTGFHVFKWTYVKDYSVSDGSDCGWIDFVVLPSGTPQTVNHIPQFETYGDSIAITGNEYIYNVKVTDEDQDSIIITAPVLPSWLTIDDKGDKTATISGIPPSESFGDTLLVIQAFDGEVFNTQVINITIQFPESANLLLRENKIQVYPNPFSQNTTVSYKLDKSSDVSIRIFDVLGTQIKEVVNVANQSGGNYKYQVDAVNLDEGIYFCRIGINSKTITIPLIITH